MQSTPARPQAHFHAGERAEQRQIVDVAEMADAERLAGELAETGAERNVEMVERDGAKASASCPSGSITPVKRGRMQPGIEAHGLEAPGRTARLVASACRWCRAKTWSRPPRRQHVDRTSRPKSRLVAGVVGEEAALVRGDHPFPRPEAAGRVGLARNASAFSADGVEAEAGRQHQPLLRAGDADVDAPFVVAIVGAGEPGNGVDQQQSGMAPPRRSPCGLRRYGRSPRSKSRCARRRPP